MKKYWPTLSILLILILAVTSWRLWKQNQALEHFNPSSVGSHAVAEVSIAQCIVGENDRPITLTGTIEPYEQAVLYARVTGYISDVSVDIGDEVAESQVLAVISVPDLDSKLKSSEAEVVAATARIEKTRADSTLLGLMAGRVSNLLKSSPGAVSDQQLAETLQKYDQSVAQLHVAEAELQVAQSRRDELQSFAHYSTIHAPFRGTVTRRMVDVGNLVTSGSMQSPIVEIMRSDFLRLKMEIPDYAAPRVNVGQSISFYLSSAEGRMYEASITRIAGALSSSTRTMRAESDLSNTAREYRPGMFCTVFLVLQGSEDDIRIPSRALRKEKKELFVLTAENGRASKVPVELVYDDGKECTVKCQLSSATPVIISGPVTLAAGDSVRVASSGGSAS
ncbi:efflux RND transporter periplasmic adaptor subunit [candidate division KSB1 bacterium]|nr:efflux RND transporter periplasmic adaptor subunit [candidate division KSB1 bacterium]